MSEGDLEMKIYLVIEERVNGVEVVHVAFTTPEAAEQYIMDEKRDVDASSDVDSRLYVEEVMLFDTPRARGYEELRAAYLK